MKNREKVFDCKYQKNYQPCNYGFNLLLVKHVTKCWTPNPEICKINSFIQCLNVMTTGNILPISLSVENILKESSINMTQKFLNEKERNIIANAYQVIVDVYYEKAIFGGREIVILETLGEKNTFGRIGLCKSYKDFCYYMAFIPNRNTFKLDLVYSKNYCNTCGNWRSKKDWNKHINGPERCCKCKCGKTYKFNDGHYIHCNKNHFSKSNEDSKHGICKKYEKENIEKLSFEGLYFADFETFTKPDDHYTVYAGAWADSNDNNEVNIFYGKSALDRFMESIIQNCSGVLWFFNGTKFDNFFILQWLVERKIKIFPWSILMTSSSLLSIEFKTKKGSIVIKDLCKFLDGSLKANCHAFGLPVDKSKSEFDHNRIKTWYDVMTWEEESRDYLRLDVIALRDVYKRFAESMFTIYKLNVAKFTTIGQIAYASFSSNLRDNVVLYRTKAGVEEEIIRELYKGGRVICGRKIWKTKLFDKIISESFRVYRYYTDEEISKMKIDDPLEDLIKRMEEVYDGDAISPELYKEIGKDYLVDVDVNSLYPTVQVDIAYPHGKKMFYDNLSKREEKILIQQLEWKKPKTTIEKEKRKKNKELWFRRAAQVDIKCPNDLSIAFLMEKKKKGGVKQNLLPKKKIWYTGPELWEACVLGYKILKIYQYVEWEKSSVIFNDFVLPTYEVKSKNKKGSPLYSTAKTALVALTGKFGQRNVLTPITLFYPDDILKKDLSKISEITNLEGDFLCYYGEERKTFSHSPYPIELSAFILAHSRIYMSKILRKMKIHKAYEGNYDETPIYGDTDSLFLFKKSWNRLPQEMKGDKKLGQLKLEIDGKIIAAFVLAPKTYCLVYVDKKTKKLMVLVKSKGIPHYKDPYYFLETKSLLKTDLFQKAVDESDFLKDRRKKQQTRTVFYKDKDITRRWYIFRDLTKGNEVVDVCERIPGLYIEKILNKIYSLECIFGTMKRNLQPGESCNIFVAPDSKTRIYNKNDWWDEVDKEGNYINRCYSHHEIEKEYPTSYPIGHFMLKK